MRNGALTVIDLAPSMSAGWLDGEGVAELRSRGDHAWILMRRVSYPALLASGDNGTVCAGETL